MAPSPFPELDIPTTDLWSFLFERDDKPFADSQVIFRHPISNRHYTSTSLKSTAQQFSQTLTTTFQFKKGDVLALFTTNSIDVPFLTYGTLNIGGVVSPANPAYTAGELAFHLKDSGAKVLVTTRALLKTALQAAKEVGLSEDRILIVGTEEDADSSLVLPHLSIAKGGSKDSVLKTLPPSYMTSRPNASAQDLAFLVYSSGTTGVPKGVELTHHNIISCCCMVAFAEGENKFAGREGLRSGRDKILSVLPQYHIYGLQCLIHVPVYLGVEILVPPAFQLQSFCETVQHHKVTYAYVAPPIVLHLAKSALVSNYDLSSLRFVTSGAAPLTKDLILQVHERLGLPVKQAYGLSETSPVTHIQLWDSTWMSKIGSVGPCLPNLETRFVGSNGKEVPTGVEGELWIKGPTVFRGYHANEAATKDSKTEDGWFKTGDIGFEDGGRNMHITDRVKELIKYKGSQVAPAELEGILLGHPGVEDCAVIGRWVEAMHTEVPCAFVVLKGGAVSGEHSGIVRSEEQGRAIVEWMAERTAKTKWLRGGICWVDEVPKSGSGKILRRVLKEHLKHPMIRFAAESVVSEAKI